MNVVPLECSAVPLRAPVYARYARLYIEQYGMVRGWAAPIVYGTDYIIDGVYVLTSAFDRIMRLEGIP